MSKRHLISSSDEEIIDQQLRTEDPDEMQRLLEETSQTGNQANLADRLSPEEIDQILDSGTTPGGDYEVNFNGKIFEIEGPPKAKRPRAGTSAQELDSLAGSTSVLDDLEVVDSERENRTPEIQEEIDVVGDGAQAEPDEAEQLYQALLRSKQETGHGPTDEQEVEEITHQMGITELQGGSSVSNPAAIGAVQQQQVQTTGQERPQSAPSASGTSQHGELVQFVREHVQTQPLAAEHQVEKKGWGLPSFGNLPGVGLFKAVLENFQPHTRIHINRNMLPFHRSTPSGEQQPCLFKLAERFAHQATNQQNVVGQQQQNTTEQQAVEQQNVAEQGNQVYSTEVTFEVNEEVQTESSSGSVLQSQQTGGSVTQREEAGVVYGAKRRPIIAHRTPFSVPPIKTQPYWLIARPNCSPDVGEP